MKAEGQKTLAAAILQLLLDQSSQLFEMGEMGWHELLDVAARNCLLVRATEQLRELGSFPPTFFSEAEKRERQRAQGQIELIRTISQVCSASGLEFIFPKAFRHYPDMGRDLDLFVLTRPEKVEALLVEALNASPLKKNFWNRLDGSVCYKIAGCESPLDIHHRRLGSLGEHGSFLEIILRNSKEIRIAGGKFLTPSPEDQMILQAMQRVYGRRYIRVSDIVSSISSIRKDDLDWDYLIKTTNQLGIFHGLCCYLSYVNQIHSEVFRSDLLSSELRNVLILDGWGKVEFEDPYYTFPNIRVAGWLYSKKLQAALLSGDFDVASRLCMTPLAAIASAFRKASQGVNRGFSNSRNSE
jgi:hypothetical protein